MTAKPKPFIIFIGTSIFESVQSKLRASGLDYIQKRLDSGPENWQVTNSLLQDPDLHGAVAIFTADTYRRLLNSTYAEVRIELLKGLADQQALILVHQAVLTGQFGVTGDEQNERWMMSPRDFFGEVSTADREKVRSLISSFGLQLTPYARNAEASILSTSYVDDRQNNLLFRLYVPNGRLYGKEISHVLDLFHEWMTAVKGYAIRQSGYKTTFGEYIEFFSGANRDIPAELAEFSGFLSRVDDSSIAENQLRELGISSSDASVLVSRYRTQLRRLRSDMRHDYERRSLAIRQEAEDELLELTGTEISEESIADVVTSLLPLPEAQSLAALQTPQLATSQSRPITVNQQFISKVEGIVASNISGVPLSASAEEFLRIISLHGGSEIPELTAAVYQLEDTAAPAAQRLGARHRLKGFLAHAGTQVEKVAIGVLQAYIESVLRV